MKHGLITATIILLAGLTAAHATEVKPIFSHDLEGIPGKEGLMLTVEYGPGDSDPIHRHDANVFVYVLEGSIVMQVKGKEPVTLQSGQTYYEAPDDVHLVGRNASKTKPARFLVFFVKNKGTPPVIPVKPVVPVK